MKFDQFGLKQPIVDALIKADFNTPTPVQEKMIPLVLSRKDVMAQAQTGTGKTAAFVLPILHQLEKLESPKARALILVPTRELAVQTFDVVKKFGRYLKLRGVCLYGGTPHKKQRENLRIGADIIIATPGRLLDFIEQREVSLKNIEIVVLDEADRMLDMGFIHDIEKIIDMLPSNHQSILTSATLPKPIKTLANSFLNNPENIIVTPNQLTAQTVDQFVIYTKKSDKKRVVKDILNLSEVKKAMIFTRTKVNADRLKKRLDEFGISSLVIHGDKSQGERIQSIRQFTQGKVNVLIATDVAARGIDIPDITHVINYELADDNDSYVHRIGRAGRAHHSGKAISLICEEELQRFKEIESMIKQPIQEVHSQYSISISHHKTNQQGLSHKQRKRNTKNASNNRKSIHSNKNKNSSKRNQDINLYRI